MRVLEVRPARVSAALVEIGDMLVTSPIGANGPRPSTWLGAVTEHVIVEDERVPADWRRWRLQLVDGRPMETTKIPADGWVWVHLPSSDLPNRPSDPAWHAEGLTPDMGGAVES